MARYVAIGFIPKPINIGDDIETVGGSPTTFTVNEKINAPVDTGLLDNAGIKLYRLEEVERIGFDI